jgi:hypothetical protein
MPPQRMPTSRSIVVALRHAIETLLVGTWLDNGEHDIEFPKLSETSRESRRVWQRSFSFRDIDYTSAEAAIFY